MADSKEINVNEWEIGTKCIQAGYRPGIGEPRVLPIFQTTTYKYEDVDEVERLFSLQQSGNKYSRTGNPTLNALEAKVAALEGGVGALTAATGQAAVFIAISNIVQAGDHIVASNAIYGGTYTLLDIRLRKLGIETTFVDPEASEDELRKAFKPNTRILFGETLGNPALGILDFDKFSKLAKEFDVPFLVDNTLATPFLCKPIKHGANVVIHSGTKYLDGHAVALGRIIVDGGNFFNVTGSDKYQLCRFSFDDIDVKDQAKEKAFTNNPIEELSLRNVLVNGEKTDKQ